MRINVAGFGIVDFPDSMSESEVQQALDRMRRQGQFGPTTPAPDERRTELVPNTGASHLFRRAESQSLYGEDDDDITPLSADEEQKRAATRSRLADIREHGDIGTVDTSDEMKTSVWNMMPSVAEQSPSQRYVREKVLNNAWAPVIGGAERLGLVPEGTREAVRENYQEASDRYLLAHPDGGIGRAIALAAGDVAASVGGPAYVTALAAGSLAGSATRALGGSVGAGRLTGFAAGAVEGLGQSALDTIDLPDDERLRNAGFGALLGGFGAMYGNRRIEDVDVGDVAGAARAHGAAELPNPGDATARRIEMARRDPALRELETVSQRTASDTVLSQYDAARQQLDAEIDNALAANSAAAQRSPQQVRVASPEEAQAFREQRYRAFDNEWNPIIRDSASTIDDVSLHELADRTEAPPVEVQGPTPRADGIGPGGRFSPAEAGAIGPFGSRTATTTTATATTPTPSPAERVIRYDDVPREPLRDRLRKAADRLVDQLSDKEDAPIRILRRAELPEAARQIERYIGRARGAGRIAKLALFKGVRRFDPVTGNTTRVHDSLNSVVGGLDNVAERDLNNYMAARHHMELVGRRDHAQLEYDMARAARLEDLRQARRADSDSLRRMAGDVRSARADELRLARRSARAQGQSEARLDAGEGIGTEARRLRGRGSRLEQEAAAAAQRTLSTGFDESSAEFAVAAQYARRVLRQELQNEARGVARNAASGAAEDPATTTGTQTPSRSPSAVTAAETAGRAHAAVAEKLGLAEGQTRALLRGSRELGSGAEGLDRLGVRQGEAAGRAMGRQAGAETLAPGAASHSLNSVSAARRVAMGIRDQATRLYREHQRVEPHPDVHLDIDDEGTQIAQQILGDIERRYGATVDPTTGTRRVNELDDIADGVRSWSTAAVIDQLDSVGYFAPGQRAALLGAGQQYAPFFRLLDDVASDSQFVSGGTSSTPIKRISGGLSPKTPIAPPLESFIAQSQRVAVWVERQRINNLLGDYAEAHPDTVGAEIRRVSSGSDSRSHPAGTFTVLRDGKRIQYTGPDDLIRAVSHTTPEQASIFLQAGVAAARLLRAGATLTLDFAVRNLLRDQASATAYGAEFKYRPTDSFVGLWAQTKFASPELRQFAEGWEASGGALSDYISIERPDIQYDLKSVRNTTLGQQLLTDWRAEQNKIVKYVLYPVLKPLETVSSRVEQGTRIGAYRRAKLGGASDLEGGFYSRNITLDFGQSGTLGQRWNSVEAFSNAALLDVARFSRAMRERPIATTMQAAAYITLPALASWAKYKDDPQYQALPEWERAAFLHVAKMDDGRWVRIPRPQGLLNLVYGYGVVKMLDAARGTLDKPVSELLSVLFNETPLRFSPVQPDPSIGGTVRGSFEAIPSALQPAMEAAAGEGGWSSFRQSPIVPAGMQDSLLPEDRAGDTTTSTARLIGRKMDVAPLKVDSLIRGYGAGMTYSALQGVEKITGVGNDLPPLPMTAKDIPGVGGLVSSPSYGFATQPVQDFYALESQASAAKGSLKAAAEQGRVFDYQRILRQAPEWQLGDDLSKARRELKELRDYRRQIRTNKTLTPEMRFDMLLKIDQAVTQIAAGQMHQASDFLRAYRKHNPS